MSVLQIILVAAGGYIVASIMVTLAVTRFLHRVNRAAEANLRDHAKRKRRLPHLPRIDLRKSS